MQYEPEQSVVAPPPSVRSPEAAPAPPPSTWQAPSPTCQLSGSPSPCEQPEDAYRHDGFYFRLFTETQYLAFAGRGPEGSASVKGLGSGGHLALGGTPVPGLVIAGTLGADTLRGTFKGRPRDAQEEDASMSRASLGVLVDWYPMPEDGWHVGVSLAFAGITLRDAAIKDSVGGTFAAKIFGGYDWWIGPQWSLGTSAVLATTPSTPLVDRDGDKNGYRFYTLSAGVAWSLTLH